jgi:type I restriction enzyme M protein
MSLSTTIKAIQDTMRTDVGVDGDAQRIGQLTWLLFLKIWDDREQELEVIEPGFKSPFLDVSWFEGGETRHSRDLRWRMWASNPEGLTGDSLIDFVDRTLFPALKNMELGPVVDGAVEGSEQARRLRSRRLLVREAFEDAYQYMKSGTLLRQVINRLQTDIDFNDARNRHLFGEIYEQILRDLQGAGNAGEYYTPRSVTDFAVDVVQPRLGEIVMDPACGTGGFLTGAITFVRRREVRTSEQEAVLQVSVRGIEKKPLPHLLCVTNMIVHGIDVPTGIVRDNALSRPLREITVRDRVDVILTNPPFRGMEEAGIENNFPLEIRTRETADLFLALVLELLRPGGRGAIVLPDSSLFSDGVKEVLRRRLVEECDLHTIVRLPNGVFSPYTDIRTNVLFFRKAGSTKSVWYYELPCPYGDRYTKTKPITGADFDDARGWWQAREESTRAWEVPVADVVKREYRLDFENPRKEDAAAAYRRHARARQTLVNGVAEVQEAVKRGLNQSEWPVGPRVRELFEVVLGLAPTASLTSGVLENLRRALTDLALRGELSCPEAGDELVATTLSRYEASTRRVRLALRVEPPFAVPARWSWARLSEVTDFKIGRTPSTQEERYWIPGASNQGIPWVAIGDMPRRGLVTETDRHVTEAAVAEVFKSEPTKSGSLLVAFKLSVGKTAMLGVDAYHNEAIASIMATDEALRRYLVWAVPALVTHSATNPAVRGATLNSRSIAELWIPIPPREEQVRIVESLTWASDLLETVADSTEAMRDESDVVVKLLSAGRALTASPLP